MSQSAITSEIKELRIKKNLSQEELSEKTGLSLRTIQRIENGESVPRGETLKRLTEALELPADYFNKLVEDKKQNSLISKLKISWFLVGSVIIFGSIGRLIGLLLIVYTNIIPFGGPKSAFQTAVTMLFVGIGITVGYFIEKNTHK